jgi:hypothetical protein
MIRIRRKAQIERRKAKWPSAFLIVITVRSPGFGRTAAAQRPPQKNGLQDFRLAIGPIGGIGKNHF